MVRSICALTWQRVSLRETCGSRRVGTLPAGDEIPEGQLATTKAILYGDAAVDSSKYPEVEQLISAVQFAAGDGRTGSLRLRGSTWETDLNF